CYVARLYGVRSAMPMFKALELCPKAQVVAPNMRKYRETSMIIRQAMLEFTHNIQPLSLDEAYLDLSNVQAEFALAPAQALNLLLARIESRAGVSASAGLSYNKFLAKTASDIDKPKGYFVINAQDAKAFLAPRDIASMRGVGKATTKRLLRLGIETIGDLQQWERADLAARFGIFGNQLYDFAHAIDHRPVCEAAKSKSISAETTFFRDRASPQELLESLIPLLETVVRRLQRQKARARTVTVKLRTVDFQIHTRSRSLRGVSDNFEQFRDIVLNILEKIDIAGPYRLAGVGLSGLQSAHEEQNLLLWQE
ncbi:MAG: DNA polymerase IV, partial [Pseudomonadota bacterium]